MASKFKTFVSAHLQHVHSCHAQFQYDSALPAIWHSNSLGLSTDLRKTYPPKVLHTKVFLIFPNLTFLAPKKCLKIQEKVGDLFIWHTKSLYFYPFLIIIEYRSNKLLLFGRELQQPLIKFFAQLRQFVEWKHFLLPIDHLSTLQDIKMEFISAWGSIYFKLL